MLGFNITFTEKLSKKQKLFVQTIMCNGKLNKNYLSARMCLYENLKPKSSMPLPPDPDSLTEDLKYVHLECYV